MEHHNPQHSSIFFRSLPLEIRMDIYSHVFYSTRLSFGQRLTKYSPESLPTRLTGFLRTARLRPAQNSLSLLRVCRRVNCEIGQSWVSQVLFSFEDAETMLGNLAALEPSILARLRHMRISGYATMFLFQGHHQNMSFGWAHPLKLLRGLCLDRLTIIGGFSPEINYHVLNELIQHSDGWKELYYLSRNSATPGLDRHVWCISALSSQLENRDGSRASISMFQSSDAAEYGVLISKPASREAYTGPIAEPVEEDGAEDAGALMGLGEKEKELLVVVRRGKGVDYAVKPGSSPLNDDVKQMEVLRSRTLRQDRNDNIKVDTYKHVDDYEWASSYFDQNDNEK